MLTLKQVTAHNFASLQDVTVKFSPLTVLVGPNNAGKSNLLKLFRFLGETARVDLGPAIDSFGGFDALLFRGKLSDRRIRITVQAQFTKYASGTAPDRYTLTVWRSPSSQNFYILRRSEKFAFKRTKGPGRRITLSGSDVTIESADKQLRPALKVQASSAGLSILRRLGRDFEAAQVNDLASLFETLRVFDVNVDAARRPSTQVKAERLSSDARELASYLNYLRLEHADLFERLMDDMRQVVPTLRAMEMISIGGSTEGVAINLVEAGLTKPTPLALASYGTIRALALFAMLHDPDPPKLTCIEEIDHGLHPHVLDRLVERLRDASTRTQIIVATHSPALVNRLEADELLVFERNAESGATRIPTLSATEVRQMEQESGLNLGELWFSGTLGGSPMLESAP